MRFIDVSFYRCTFAEILRRITRPVCFDLFTRLPWREIITVYRQKKGAAVFLFENSCPVGLYPVVELAVCSKNLSLTHH